MQAEKHLPIFKKREGAEYLRAEQEAARARVKQEAKMKPVAPSPTEPAPDNRPLPPPLYLPPPYPDWRNDIRYRDVPSSIITQAEAEQYLRAAAIYGRPSPGFPWGGPSPLDRYGHD